MTDHILSGLRAWLAKYSFLHVHRTERRHSRLSISRGIEDSKSVQFVAPSPDIPMPIPMITKLTHAGPVSDSKASPATQNGFATFRLSDFPVTGSLNSFQLMGYISLPSSLVAMMTPSSLRAVLR